MDYVDRLSGRAFQNVNPATLLKFTPLDPRVQHHLLKVYATLAAAVALSAVGAYGHILYNLGGIITTIGAFGCLVWLSSISPRSENLTKRYALLGTFAFCQGCSIGPLVQLALNVNVGILATAFLGTAAIFCCFSLAALLTQRRSYLFLGGILSSSISTFMFMRLGGWLFGVSAFTFQLELYLGLLVFSLYVIFDTQLIVEKASAGDFDTVKHALDLFVDFFAIFVRVLIILLQNQEKREKRKEKRKE